MVRRTTQSQKQMDDLDKLLQKPIKYWQVSPSKLKAAARRHRLKPHLPLADCSICRGTETQYYADFLNNSGDIPKALSALVGDADLMGGVDLFNECPICGAFYASDRATGFMENDLTVTRISPTRAGIKPTIKLLKAWTHELHHPDLYTRQYAAQCLTDYYATEKDISKLKKILAHPDREVRLMAVVYLRTHEDSSYQALLARVHQEDPDAQVRLNAGI